MDFKKRRTIIIIIATIILITSIIAIKSVDKSDEYMKRCTEPTTGIVIDYKMTTTTKKYGSGIKYFHHITTKYTVDGKEYETKGSYKGKKTESLKPGDKIYIKYNPNNLEEIIPKFATGYLAIDESLDKKIMIIIPTVLSLLTLLVYLFYCNKKYYNPINKNN